MVNAMDSARRHAELVRRLIELPSETEWVEFKENKFDPDEIGAYVSALSNSAALAAQPFAYLVWGIEDRTHRVVGAVVSPETARIGNEQFENWLVRLLTPRITLDFHECTVADNRVVLLEISKAYDYPVRFKGQGYIRIGSYTHKLAQYPEKERALWRTFDRSPFEQLVAEGQLRSEQVLRLVDYPAYFELMNRPLPESRDGILEALQSDGLIRLSPAGDWEITNLGTLLFARRLDDFSSVRRKAFRVIRYRGVNRVETMWEQGGTSGYASSFEGLIGSITAQSPPNEVIGQALRREVPMYPVLAVRELVANALIHQDFSITGAGPMAEIFDDRIEITNPGVPLVATERFLDSLPRSKNEQFASLARRMGICEERGSGIDKVVSQTERYQLPAPAFEVVEENTRAVLFAHRPLNRMDREDRIRTCYLHACLRYVERDFMTNTTLRGRFGIDPRNSATASRLIKEAVEAGAIKPYDETAARKLMKYVPFWA